MHFHLAVIGPIAGSGLGMARHCIGCHHPTRLAGGRPCAGFGPGCLGYRPVEMHEAARRLPPKPIRAGGGGA